MKSGQFQWRTAGVVLGFVVLGGIGFGNGHLSDRDYERMSANRPKSIFDRCSEYATNNNGLLPALSGEFGRFMFDCEELSYPLAYRSTYTPEDDDPWRHLHRGHLNTFANDCRCVYLGYCIRNEKQALAFLDTYQQRAAEAQPFDEDLVVGPGLGNCGTDTLYRLRTCSNLPDELACIKENPETVPLSLNGSRTTGKQPSSPSWTATPNT